MATALGKKKEERKKRRQSKGNEEKIIEFKVYDQRSKYASLSHDLRTVKKLAKLWKKSIAVKRTEKKQPGMSKEQQKSQYGLSRMRGQQQERRSGRSRRTRVRWGLVKYCPLLE